MNSFLYISHKNRQQKKSYGQSTTSPKISSVSRAYSQSYSKFIYIEYLLNKHTHTDHMTLDSSPPWKHLNSYHGSTYTRNNNKHTMPLRKRMRSQIYYNRLENFFLFAFDNRLVSGQILAQHKVSFSASTTQLPTTHTYIHIIFNILKKLFSLYIII